MQTKNNNNSKKEVPYEVVCKTCNDQILRFLDIEKSYRQFDGFFYTEFVNELTNNHAARKHYNDIRSCVFCLQRETKKRPRKPKWKMARRESIVV